MVVGMMEVMVLAAVTMVLEVQPVALAVHLAAARTDEC